MAYRVFLIEKGKRVFLRGFNQYEKAFDYCKKAKREALKESPNIYFLIRAYSKTNVPMTLYNKQIAF